MAADLGGRLAESLRTGCRGLAAKKQTRRKTPLDEIEISKPRPHRAGSQMELGVRCIQFCRANENPAAIGRVFGELP